MQTNNAYNTYKSNSINHASKEQLLLMLLEGAIKFAKLGRQAIVDGDIGKAHENIIKVQNIYCELMATINMEAAGEWGASMYEIYDFIVHRLIDANNKKDVAIMNEIIPLIEDIKNMWEEAYNISKNKV